MSRRGFSSSRGGGFRNYGYGQKRDYYGYNQNYGSEEKYGESEEFEHRNANRQPLTKRPKTDDSEDSTTPKTNLSSSSTGEKSAVRLRFERAKMKEWRLIIRNLPFKTKKEDLQNICSNIGRFAEIVLPPSKKNPKTSAGFGFIQFVAKEDAEKGKEYFNNNKVLGRSVAADWALDKDTYETNAHDEKEHLKKVVKVEKVEEEKKKKNVQKVEDHDEEANDSDEEENEEDEDEDDNKNDDDSDDDFDVDDDDEGSDKKKKKKPAVERKTDQAIIDGKVVFLRNLSFETKVEQIKEELSKFGQIDLAIICKYKDSGHSKGTAFVHFSTPLEASNCIEGIEEGTIIDNRLVKANLAIPRKEAADMEKDKLTKVPKDRRNLRLARFGLIRDGTTAAAGMSKEDAAKRERIAEAMRKKLENTNMFISPVRLCIHNLPQKINDLKLKDLAQKSTSAGAQITECRVWMDKKRLTPDGKPKSSGFGFIAFKEHMHALECLKKLNNNPETFHKDSRPIVEFSVENLLALQARARRNVKNTTEKMSERVTNEKIRQQVKQSIGEVHTAGMKFLPKFTGKKIRHRNLSGRAKKNIERVKAAKNTKQPEIPAGVGKKKKAMKKNVSKYLSLST
ncbi:hypothetical protein CAEBREN_32547 [Caenorhabditis brenneri]|uniref:RRM domain-containing protein n=1 Tax=Caenorhabditis brenneri TaxID=135651 RepID=G0PG92_CAEBE|nr:hypothetical protein CAEBREN_32547 [Caenorhabditis brenneri]